MICRNGVHEAEFHRAMGSIPNQLEVVCNSSILCINCLVREKVSFVYELYLEDSDIRIFALTQNLARLIAFAHMQI